MVNLELFLYLIKPNALKTYGGVEVYFCAFLTLALDGGEWSASDPRPLYLQGKSSPIPLDRRLGGP